MKLKGIYRKLTNPLAISKNAGAQINIDGRAKKIDRIRKIEENKSMKLNTSPVRINILLMNRRNEQKRIRGRKGFIPKTRSRNVSAAKISIAPNIFTNTILVRDNCGLYVLWVFFSVNLLVVEDEKA